MTAAAPAPLPQAVPAASTVLAEAQALWNAGARQAAFDMLRDALAVSEKSLAGRPPGVALPTVMAQVRELARMGIALGQLEPVMTVFVRLEGPMQEQPEMWALRGNVAQRQGHHEDSVHAYLAALKLRPDEGRWMLGAAVSLAALGQKEAAAQWHVRSEQAGVVNPEISAYLRQLGVPVK